MMKIGPSYRTRGLAGMALTLSLGVFLAPRADAVVLFIDPRAIMTTAGQPSSLAIVDEPTQFDFTAAFPQFNPALGNLLLARMSLVTSVGGTWTFINTDLINPASVNSASDIQVHVELDPGADLIAWDMSGTLANCCGPGSAPGSFSLAGGEQRVFSGIGISSGRDGPTFTTGLSRFIGTGSIELEGSVSAIATVLADPSVQGLDTLTATAYASIHYEYEPIP